MKGDMETERKLGCQCAGVCVRVYVCGMCVCVCARAQT